MDVGAFPLAATLIRAVAKRFPSSMRMKRLKVMFRPCSLWERSPALIKGPVLSHSLRVQGMYWEAQGQFDQAEEIYKDMLSSQPTCEIAHKRMVNQSACSIFARQEGNSLM